MESGLVFQLTGEKSVEYPYHELCRHLCYLTKTRPDIEFPLNQCCRMQSHPEETHVQAIKRIVRYLKKNISYLFIEGCKSQHLLMKLQKSTYGYCIFVNGNPIVWKSVLSYRELRFYYIRDKVKNGEIAIEKVGIDDNVADMFTKVLGRIKFQKHCDSIMNNGHF